MVGRLHVAKIEDRKQRLTFIYLFLIKRIYMHFLGLVTVDKYFLDLLKKLIYQNELLLQVALPSGRLHPK